MSKLERVTHICLITVSLVSVYLLIERRFAPVGGPSPAAKEMLGKRLDAPGVNWQVARLNAVLYFSTRCRYCEESIPFYKRVGAIPDRTKQGVALSVLSLEPPEDVRSVLSKAQVAVDNVYRVPMIPLLSADC